MRYFLPISAPVGGVKSGLNLPIIRRQSTQLHCGVVCHHGGGNAYRVVNPASVRQHEKNPFPS
jgi:hypothetical protein